MAWQIIQIDCQTQHSIPKDSKVTKANSLSQKTVAMIFRTDGSETFADNFEYIHYLTYNDEEDSDF